MHISQNAGSFADPGGDACPKSANGMGKHKYKFGKCTVCKKSEHGGRAAAAPDLNKIKSPAATCPPCSYKFGKVSE